jgi:hypothetical protein
MITKLAEVNEALAWVTAELATATAPRRVKALTHEQQRLHGIAAKLERVCAPPVHPWQRGGW